MNVVGRTEERGSKASVRERERVCRGIMVHMCARGCGGMGCVYVPSRFAVGKRMARTANVLVPRARHGRRLHDRTGAAIARRRCRHHLRILRHGHRYRYRQRVRLGRSCCAGCTGCAARVVSTPTLLSGARGGGSESRRRRGMLGALSHPTMPGTRATSSSRT